MGKIKAEIMRLHDIVYDGLFNQNIEIEDLNAWMRDQIPTEEWEFFIAHRSIIMDMIESE